MTPRQARLGVDIFTGLVITTVALALANLTWRLQGYTGYGPAAAPVVTGGATADIRPILALAPFGSAVAATPQDGGGTIQLRGIFLVRPMEASVVLIAGTDGKVASYTVGQSVGNGVITSIETDQITLQTASGQRVIGFDPDAGGSLTGGTVAQTPATAAPTASAPPSSAPQSGVAAIRALIPPSAQGLPQPAPASAPAAPPRRGDVSPSASGYRVGSSPNSRILAAGIRPGDVIERVNGTAVGAGSNERDLMASAMAAGSAKIDLVRNGQRLSITVPVR